MNKSLLMNHQFLEFQFNNTKDSSLHPLIKETNLHSQTITVLIKE